MAVRQLLGRAWPVLERGGAVPEGWARASRVAPSGCKHLAFDGRLLHGALHELAKAAEAAGAAGAARCDGADGEGGGSGAAGRARRRATRVTLLVNLWAGRTPRGCARVPERLAAQLSTCPPHSSTLP